MSLLFITHDIALASEIADRIAVFRHGRLVEIGATADHRQPAATIAYTRALLDAASRRSTLTVAAYRGMSMRRCFDLAA